MFVLGAKLHRRLPVVKAVHTACGSQAEQHTVGILGRNPRQEIAAPGPFRTTHLPKHGHSQWSKMAAPTAILTVAILPGRAFTTPQVQKTHGCHSLRQKTWADLVAQFCGSTQTNPNHRCCRDMWPYSFIFCGSEW